VVDATLWVRNNSAAQAPYVSCTLAAGGDTDLKSTELRANDGGGGHRAAYALQVVHNYAAAGTATLTCSGGVDTDANNIKITAIKIDHLSNVAG